MRPGELGLIKPTSLVYSPGSFGRHTLEKMTPPDFSLIHVIAILLLFGSWFTYSAFLTVLGQGSLNTQLGIVRMQ